MVKRKKGKNKPCWNCGNTERENTEIGVVCASCKTIIEMGLFA